MNGNVKKIIQKAREGNSESQATPGGCTAKGKKSENHSENHFTGMRKRPFPEPIGSCITI